MRLKLADISSDIQTRLNIGADEEVVFARLEHGAYRDGVRFANGREISLQLLGAGVSISLVETEKQTTAQEAAIAAVQMPAPTIIWEGPNEEAAAARSHERVLELID
jgi:hypothetical protein